MKEYRSAQLSVFMYIHTYTYSVSAVMYIIKHRKPLILYTALRTTFSTY